MYVVTSLPRRDARLEKRNRERMEMLLICGATASKMNMHANPNKLGLKDACTKASLARKRKSEGGFMEKVIRDTRETIRIPDKRKSIEKCRLDLPPNQPTPRMTGTAIRYLSDLQRNEFGLSTLNSRESAAGIKAAKPGSMQLFTKNAILRTNHVVKKSGLLAIRPLKSRKKIHEK